MKKLLWLCLGCAYFFLIFHNTFTLDWAVLSPIDLSHVQQQLLAPKNSVVFEKKLPILATQVLFSWNMLRPRKGYFDFYMKVRNAKNKKWGQWVLVASWGSGRQRSYGKKIMNEPSFNYVRWEANGDDAIDRCRVKVMAHDGASLDALYRLGISAINYVAFQSEQKRAHHLSFPSKQIRSLPLFSQIHVNHPQKNRICSPTSLAMVVSYLNRQKEDVAQFSQGVYDAGLDTFGSWPFNIAHAFNQCHANFYFSVTRLNSFEELYRYLVKSLPVVVSIRGPLKTMPVKKTYSEGHLLVVVGWDNKQKKVLCHDPAFETKKDVLHAYDIKDFLRVWEKSKRLSYIVEPRL